ncbi:MAG: hypothetical protein IMY67_04260 [Bacteroidetes bacterium]|nr:hypothetical protein [Bacteroidota bacterium]
MKKFIFLLLLPTLIFAQDKINSEKISFIYQSDSITNAIGWSYNETLGEWVDFQNVISHDKQSKKEGSLKLSDELTSFQKQNFSSIHVRTVSVASKIYCVLIINKLTGEYKYPSVKKRWSYKTETVGHIFTEKDFKKLFIYDKIIVEANTPALASQYTNEYNEKEFLAQIQSAVLQLKSDSNLNYIFPVKRAISNGEQVVRFYLPYQMNSSNKYNFSKEYFEISKREFDKLIIN